MGQFSLIPNSLVDPALKLILKLDCGPTLPAASNLKTEAKPKTNPGIVYDLNSWA